MDEEDPVVHPDPVPPVVAHPPAPAVNRFCTINIATFNYFGRGVGLGGWIVNVDGLDMGHTNADGSLRVNDVATGDTVCVRPSTASTSSEHACESFGVLCVGDYGLVGNILAASTGSYKANPAGDGLYHRVWNRNGLVLRVDVVDFCYSLAEIDFRSTDDGLKANLRFTFPLA